MCIDLWQCLTVLGYQYEVDRTLRSYCYGLNLSNTSTSSSSSSPLRTRPLHAGEKRKRKEKSIGKKDGKNNKNKNKHLCTKKRDKTIPTKWQYDNYESDNGDNVERMVMMCSSTTTNGDERRQGRITWSIDNGEGRKKRRSHKVQHYLTVQKWQGRGGGSLFYTWREKWATRR